jgi:hypothetical protein
LGLGKSQSANHTKLGTAKMSKEELIHAIRKVRLRTCRNERMHLGYNVRYLPSPRSLSVRMKRDTRARPSRRIRWEALALVMVLPPRQRERRNLTKRACLCFR